MTTSQAIQILFAGLTLGSVYALVAFGLALVYRATSILNVAQGDFSMLGGMAAIFLAVGLSLPIPVAILGALLFVIAVALLMERFAIRPAAHFPMLILVIVTVALSMTLQGLALVLWGRDSFSLPAFLGSDPISFLGAAILPQAIGVLVVCGIVSLGFWAFFDRTMVGIAMRASAENPLAASLIGIDPRRMTMLAFVLSGSVGAIAGVLVAPIVFMSFMVGISLTVKGFVAAVVGGINNNLGVVVGGLTLGLLESLIAGVFPSLYKDVITLGLLLVLLCLRPMGILGGR
ncbi:MAG: branched-chain amino acid ABC transporter permease [Dehalococcoidia bacterium]|nr:branched-chain amino acid ABC transporter permease [Dehalococcoidia bacterium]